jgi:hypothetical protein
MPKARFSSVDVRAMTLALRESIVGYRVANVYDLNPRTYLLKLSKPDAKLTLLIESGVRMHATTYARDKGAVRRRAAARTPPPRRAATRPPRAPPRPARRSRRASHSSCARR